MALRGLITGVTSGTIEGWAFFTECQTKEAIVVVNCEGGFSFRGKCDLYNQSYVGVGKTDGRCGFRIPISFQEDVKTPLDVLERVTVHAVHPEDSSQQRVPFDRNIFKKINENMRHSKSSSNVAPSERKVAVFTIFYNEPEFFDVWHRYYSYEFGVENVYAIDMSSTISSSAREKVNCIRIKRKNWDDRERARIAKNFSSILFEQYEFIVFTDVDEIISVDPKISCSLKDYIKNLTQERVCPTGYNIVHSVETEREINFDEPIWSQRRYWSRQKRMDKPIIFSSPTTWEPGFHSCAEPSVLDDNLVLAHLKWVDLNVCLNKMARTRTAEWSAEAEALGWGKHARSDDQKVLEFFKKVSAEVAQLHSTPSGQDMTKMNVGSTLMLDFIPDRFRSVESKK